MKYVNKFIRILNFPFYFRGEVYDPFETLTLSEQNFDVLFEDYVRSFYDALERTSNKMTREFIIYKCKIELREISILHTMILSKDMRHIKIHL